MRLAERKRPPTGAGRARTAARPRRARAGRRPAAGWSCTRRSRRNQTTAGDHPRVVRRARRSRIARHGTTRPSCGPRRERARRLLHDDALHALDVRRAGPGLRRLRGPVALVGRRPRGVLVVHLGRSSTCRPTPRRCGSSARARCRAREWFPGVELSYAEHVFRGKEDGEVAILFDGEGRRPAEWTWARAARRRPRARARPERRGVGRGDRVVAYMRQRPGDDRRVPGHRVARRDLVELLARLRRALASSTASRRSSRRSCSPSTATATAASTSTSPTSSRSCREEMPTLVDTVILGQGWFDDEAEGARRSSACRSTTRCGSSTPRHDRPAEGDRPRAGRDPARAPQEAAPAPRRARRRPGVLVHHHRLDDVELPRRPCC